MKWEKWAIEYEGSRLKGLIRDPKALLALANNLALVQQAIRDGEWEEKHNKEQKCHPSPISN